MAVCWWKPADVGYWVLPCFNSTVPRGLLLCCCSAIPSIEKRAHSYTPNNGLSKPRKLIGIFLLKQAFETSPPHRGVMPFAIFICDLLTHDTTCQNSQRVQRFDLLVVGTHIPRPAPAWLTDSRRIHARGIWEEASSPNVCGFRVISCIQPATHSGTAYHTPTHAIAQSRYLDHTVVLRLFFVST